MNYPERTIYRTVNGKPKAEKQYEVPCNTCGTKRWVYSYHIHKVGQCGTCQRSDAGKEGFKVMVKKLGGYNKAIEKMADKQRQKPSKPEQALHELLLRVEGIEVHTQVPFWYTRNGKPSAFILDFVVHYEGKQAAINVDGYYWHTRPGRAERDALLDAVISMPILHVSDIELNSALHVVEHKLAVFLEEVM